MHNCNGLSLEERHPTPRARRSNGAGVFEHSEQRTGRVIDVGVAAELIGPEGDAVVNQGGTPEVRVGVATAGRLEGALDDGDSEELERTLDRETPVHQQDSLPLDSVNGGV